MVSLTFRKLSKEVISRKYTMPEITFMVRISSWNCMCVRTMGLVTSTKFQLEILMRSMIYAIHKFQENIWRACKTFVKQPRATTGWWWTLLWMVWHFVDSLQWYWSCHDLLLCFTSKNEFETSAHRQNNLLVCHYPSNFSDQNPRKNEAKEYKIVSGVNICWLWYHWISKVYD